MPRKRNTESGSKTKGSRYTVAAKSELEKGILWAILENGARTALQVSTRQCGENVQTHVFKTNIQY